MEFPNNEHDLRRWECAREDSVSCHRVFRPVKQIRRLGALLFKRTLPCRLMRPRRFHLYCIGVSKTGTHSIAAIFAKHYRSRHEPVVRETVALTVEALRGLISRKQIARRLHQLDRAVCLEMTSSWPLGYFSDILAEAFPQAKFILTLREPLWWLESELNHRARLLYHVSHGGEKARFWVDLIKVKYGPETWHYPPEEKALAAYQLPNLDAALSFYARHNRFILDSIPPERLLIVHTEDLSRSAERLASFAGVPVANLNIEQSHEFKAPLKRHLLAQIDQGYVQAKVEQHCAEIIALHRSAAINTRSPQGCSVLTGARPHTEGHDRD